MSITIIDRLCKPSPVVLCYLMEEEEQPLLSNPNYRRWRLLLDVTKLATGSRTDCPINSDINSPNVRTPVTPNIRTPVTPAGRAKETFLYGISSPPTAEDGYTEFMPRSRSDLTAASSLADESLGEGINREKGRESLVINVDDDEKFPARGKRRKLPRSSSAPAMVALSRIPGADAAMAARPELSSASSIVRQAVIGVVIYLSIGVGIYMWKQKEFKGKKTFPFVDGLYFCIVTMCTIGYGDIVPDSTWTKVFICLFILVGFGFIDILLSGLVTYVLDKQETVLLLSATDQGNRYEAANRYFIDVEKGRMRIRIKVALALGVVGACTGVGTLVVRSLESLSWLDSFYVTVTSVTTLGYGDYSFDTVEGRVFASIWLLVSTLAVARAFLYLAELRIDRRNRAIAKWVLQREMTVGDLMAADIDNNGSVR